MQPGVECDPEALSHFVWDCASVVSAMSDMTADDMLSGDAEVDEGGKDDTQQEGGHRCVILPVLATDVACGACISSAMW